MKEKSRGILARASAPFMEMFGLSRPTAVVTVLLLGTVVISAFFWFFHSAPPTQLTITAGAPGTSFETNAMKYKEFLARNGVTLNILPSEGSLQNLEHLENPDVQVDIGFVQGGVTNDGSKIKLISLGSISYQPLFVFYRGDEVSLLSQFKGKRVAVGHVGSGTRSLALKLLEMNDITPGGDTVLTDSEGEEAGKALEQGAVDAIFLMGDSASPQLMKKLLRMPGIRLLNFVQADGYCRRISYLNKLELPRGSLDFGKDIPAQDVALISPTVELLARPNLHPALCDLLIEAAQDTHGAAGILKKKNEFPAALEHDYPLSAEASRYYKSGKTFLYRSLPFWLASLVNRILVAFVPMIVLLIPAARLVPTLLRLGVRLRIFRWYRALLALEREIFIWPAEQRAELAARLDHIEQEVNKMRVPASYADQYYTLRGSIGFVRQRLASLELKK